MKMRKSLNRVAEVVSRVKHIQEESESKGEGASKYITDRCNAIARSELKRLNVKVDKKTGRLIEKPNCSYRYYSQLMEDYRNGVKALGFKHHAIERNINGFVSKYSKDEPELDKLLNPSLPIQKLRDNLIVLRSKAVTGSQYRKDILGLKIEHHAFYMFEPKGVIKDWISDDNKSSLNKKLHSQILVNPEWITKLASDLLTQKSPSVSDLVIGITLATGRRPTEVLKTAKFKVVDDKTLLFSGQLKTKNRHLFEEITAYPIPSLINTEIVVKALSKLRKLTRKDKLKYKNALGEVIESEVGKSDIRDYYHNRAVQKKYETTINRAVRSLMEDGNLSIKDCRALYTEITYENFKQEGESPSAYRHRVLGHSLIETQLHYDAFKIDPSVKTIQVFIPKEENEPTKKEKSKLIAYLENADQAVKEYVRAPKINIMHEWLKKQIENGLKFEEITPSYIRRHCLFEGKQLNLDTIKRYYSDFAHLDSYENN